MSQQSFFEESNRQQPSTAKRRVFVYAGQRFEDPGADYSNDEVLRFLSETYPELASGTWHSCFCQAKRGSSAL